MAFMNFLILVCGYWFCLGPNGLPLSDNMSETNLLRLDSVTVTSLSKFLKWLPPELKRDSEVWTPDSTRDGGWLSIRHSSTASTSLKLRLKREEWTETMRRRSQSSRLPWYRGLPIVWGGRHEVSRSRLWERGLPRSREVIPHDWTRGTIDCGPFIRARAHTPRALRGNGLWISTNKGMVVKCGRPVFGSNKLFCLHPGNATRGLDSRYMFKMGKGLAAPVGGRMLAATVCTFFCHCDRLLYCDYRRT